MPYPLKPFCHCVAEQIREGDAVEACPICGEMRLARPQSTARVGDMVAVRVVDGDGKPAVQSVAASICGALRQAAAEVSAPEKCPVCQGRYPDEKAELAFREEVAAEALEDAREDLAEALGLDPSEQDPLVDLFAKVRDLVEANETFAAELPASKQLDDARAHGRALGMAAAADLVVIFAEGLVEGSSKSALLTGPPPHLGAVLMALLNVSAGLRGGDGK